MNRILMAVGLAITLTSAATLADHRPNILFIAVDDLRPELGCYGVPRAITPNIDRLAVSGVRFDRAYVTYPLCLPSRASMLTGLRINYKADDKKGRGFPELIQLGTTWPKTFHDAGYWTATSGKVYHGGVPKVDAMAWDVPGDSWHKGFKDWSPEVMKKVVAEAGPKDVVAEFRKKGGGQGSLLWQAIDGDDDVLTDGQTASMVIKSLQDRPKDKPFVICAGFARPHMPWLAPKKYFDLYAKADIKLPTMPEGKPRELLKEDIGAGVSKDAAKWNEGVSDDDARELIKGYLASVSYSDAQVGRLLDTLKELGLEDKTIVVLWGDHGYHLTDHGLWRKNTIYHVSNRIPLIIRAPGYTKHGMAKGIVESIDLYPTLLELTGVKGGTLALDGKSLVPLLKNPAAEWDHAAYISGGTYHGIVTQRYRFAISDKHPAKLFDLQADANEWNNLAADPAFARMMKELTAKITDVWGQAK
jgi:choline-sulfatase